MGIGGNGYEQQLRTALATGAARAIHIACGRAHDPWNVARLLRALIERERPQLVLMGKQAVDDDANQTGQFLAASAVGPGVGALVGVLGFAASFAIVAALPLLALPVVPRDDVSAD